MLRRVARIKTGTHRDLDRAQIVFSSGNKIRLPALHVDEIETQIHLPSHAANIELSSRNPKRGANVHELRRPIDDL